MNKTSGFREIEVKEITCKYRDEGYNTEVEYCHNGMIFWDNVYRGTSLPVMTERTCPICKGTGTIYFVESKIE